MQTATTTRGQRAANTIPLFASPVCSSRCVRAFTLIEMLVVMVIIGIIASLAAPSFTNMGAGNAMLAGTRQLADDLAFARARAIANRGEVYVMFFPQLTYLPITNQPNYFSFFLTNTLANDRLGGQCIAYAMFSKRSLGDQPGRPTQKYVIDWKTLPDKIFIDPQWFTNVNIFSNAAPPNPSAGFPTPAELFPCISDMDGLANVPTLPFPFIAFDAQGRLKDFKNPVRIPISLGSVSIKRSGGATGSYFLVNTDAQERPPVSPFQISELGQVRPNVTYFVDGAAGQYVTYPANSAINYGVGSFFTGVAGAPDYQASNPALVQVKLFTGVEVNHLTGRTRIVRPEL
jgi:prepilin-type N-terminal cleavage/methylation domain-containing protein